MSKQPPDCEGGRFGGRQSGRKCGDVDDYLSDYGTKSKNCLVAKKTSKSDNLKAVEYTLSMPLPLYLMTNNLATVFIVLPGMINLTFFGLSREETFIKSSKKDENTTFF